MTTSKSAPLPSRHLERQLDYQERPEPMQPPPLTPEQCLYHDIIAAVQTAEEADIDFDAIHKLILQTLDEIAPENREPTEAQQGLIPIPDGYNEQ